MANMATTKGEIKQLGKTRAFARFVQRVQPGGDWDYKVQYGEPGKSFGNVNYGASCGLFYGKYKCGSLAGRATAFTSGDGTIQGPGIPWIKYPYGKQTDPGNMPSVMGGLDIGAGAPCSGWPAE